MFTSQAVESVVPDMSGLHDPANAGKTKHFDGFTFVDKGHLGGP